MVCVTLDHPVKVAIKNYAVFNVSGPSLNVMLINKSTGIQIGTSDSAKIDQLEPGESREIGAGAYTVIGTSLDNAACVVSLIAGNTVLDEWTRDIS